MSTALEGLTGVTCLMDDILIHGSNQQEHDEHLIAVLEHSEISYHPQQREVYVFNKFCEVPGSCH